MARNSSVVIDRYATYVCLDTEERRQLSSGNHTDSYKLNLWQKKHNELQITSDGSRQRVHLYWINGPIRDLVLLIKPRNPTLEEPMISCCLMINNNKRQDRMDAIMMRKVIPQQYYGIFDNKSPTYYMTFDHTPTSHECTGYLYLGSVKEPEAQKSTYLELTLLPGKYTVHILARQFNVLEVICGRASLLYES